MPRLGAHLVSKLAYRLSDSRVLGSMPVFVLPPGDVDLAFQRIEAALRFIDAHQPRRGHRMRTHLSRIWVKRYAFDRTRFDPDSRTCVIDIAYLTDAQTMLPEIAAVLVHQTARARIQDCGVSYDGNTAPRIVRACWGEELDFGRRCPGGERVVARAEKALARPPGEHVLDSRRARARSLAAMEVEVEELPLPGRAKRWIARAMRWFAA